LGPFQNKPSAKARARRVRQGPRHGLNCRIDPTIYGPAGSDGAGEMGWPLSMALGEPGVPVVCCAVAGRPDIVVITSAASSPLRMLVVDPKVPSVDSR
jgi:hypothetical protein